ncbi:alkaline phosphatase family protein [Nocardioides panacisoli]|uniref:Alkaline phosphatase family protein n=1 Tax=Nocardioides panacisoli TaxID=627624 RepID=A0ABP7IHX2_9ACTN
MKRLLAAALTATALLASACGTDGSDGTDGSPEVTTASAPVTDSPGREPSTPGSPSHRPSRTKKPAQPTTSAGPARNAVTKLLVFVVENHSFDQMRAGMPFTWSLAQQYGYAAHFTAITHPSLPNYLAIAGGSTFGVGDDGPPSAHPVSSPSVFGRAVQEGSTARLYADGMAGSCQSTDQGRYAVKHNPWAYFTAERSMCERDDVPLAALTDDAAAGRLPAVGMVIPDLCNDAHDCALAQADQWLSTYVQEAMSGPDWEDGHLAIVITADEDDRNHGNQILTVVAHPALDQVAASTPLTHYSLSRAYADVAGFAPLGNANGAPDLLAAFGLAPG